MDEDKAWVCPECGTVLDAELKVCPVCGCELPDEPEEAPAPTEERKGLLGWAKRNKNVLIALGVGIAVGAATVGVIKEREKIAAYAGDLEKAAKKGYLKVAEEAPKLAGKVADSKAAAELKEGLGNLAEKAVAVAVVGKKLSESAKDIKEFLADSGIAERLPDAKEALPIIGKLLGDAAKQVAKAAPKIVELLVKK